MRKSSKIVTCPDCGKEMPARGLGTHRRQMHSQSPVTVVREVITSSKLLVTSSQATLTKVKPTQVMEVGGKLNYNVTQVELSYDRKSIKCPSCGEWYFNGNDWYPKSSPTGKCPICWSR